MQNAANYNQWIYELFEKYIHGNVLEVGCGVGSFTKLITEQNNFNSLYCIDISNPAIDLMRSANFGHKVRIECIDMMDIEGEFDLIICMNVMEHVEDDRTFFNKLMRSLKSGGVLFLLVPSHKFLYSNFDVVAGHFKRYNKEMINSLSLPPDVNLLEQYYFNLIGALGYWVVYKALKSNDVNDTDSEIGIFDKYLVPLSKKILPLKTPIGISLISIYRKNNS